MNEKHIIVQAGDSWAAGAWVKHDGISQLNEGVVQKFYHMGYDVRNLAKPGGSNLESVDRLRDYLRSNQHEIDSVKLILFWKTEFFREIWYCYSNDTMQLKKELTHGYQKLRDYWIYRPYHRLAEIYQQWSIPIYMVGGCSDCVWYDEFEKDFPGIKIACQSVTNLLVKGEHRVRAPVFCEFLPGWIDKCNFLDKVKQNISFHDLEALLHDMNLGSERLNVFKENPQYFSEIHPNDLAQTIIFEYLLHKIPELALDQKKIR